MLPPEAGGTGYYTAVHDLMKNKNFKNRSGGPTCKISKMVVTVPIICPPILDLLKKVIMRNPKITK